MAISAEVKNAISALEPATLEAHGVIQKAKTGYICPLCGNGEGKDGTGIDLHEVNGTYLGKCFKCGEGFDNIKLLGLHYGLDTKIDTEFVEILKRACDEFNIPFDDDGDPYRGFVRTDKPATSESRATSTEKDNPVDPAEIEMIRADIARAQENLDSLPEGARRGLTLDTLRNFGCGFIGNWTHPKSRLKNYKDTPTPRLIIPTPNHYLARLIVPVENFPESQREYIKPKAHAGTKEPFNLPAALEYLDKTTTKILVATEGEIDAMSIYQCAPLPIVATCGTSGWQKLLAELKARGYGTSKIVRLLIMFDPDDAGRKAAEEFRNAALNGNIPAITRFLSPDVCKIDANEVLREQGEDSLIALFGDFYLHEAADKFAAVEKEIEKRRAEKVLASIATPRADSPYHIDDGAWTDILHRPLSNHFDARRLARAFEDRIRYLSDADSWGFFSNGIWTFPTGKNSVLYPYAARLTDFIDSHARALDKAVADFSAKDLAAHNSGDVAQKSDDQVKREQQLRTDSDIAQKLSARWQNRKNIGNAIELLKGVESILITSADLNNHKNLLNCLNGVVDLETGKLYQRGQELIVGGRRHSDDRTLYLTQKTRAAYIAGYHNPAVDKFLADIQPDDDTRNALIRLLGYAITGNPREEKFGFFTGGGGNGKGTLTSTLIYMLGSYAVSLPCDLLIVNRPSDPNAPTPALAALKDKRVAIVEELRPEAKWDVALIKRLSGRDPLPTRQLYSNMEVFQDPTWTLFMSGNHEPRIPDAHDVGWNRRMLKIDFAQQFTGDRCNTNLKDTLRTPLALSGLLTVLVDAAVEYHREGRLIISDEMTAAAERYIADNDIVASFVSDYCEYDADARISFKDFREKLEATYAKELASMSANQKNKMIAQMIDGDSNLSEMRKDNRRMIKGLKWLY